MPIPKKTKPSDPEVLLTKIKRHFPDLSWSDYKYIDQGWDHEVIILDEKIVFRFPANPDYLKLLKREVEVLALIKPLVSIKVPQYEYISPDYTFAGYEYIRGESLRLKDFNKLGNDSRSLFAGQLADFLSVIHAQDTGKYRSLGVPVAQMEHEQEHVRQAAQKYLKNALTEEDMGVVSEILSDVDNLIDMYSLLPKVFLHGDIYSTHLLWDKLDKQLGLIDFSDMNLGDPAFDFAELFEYGRDFVEEVCELYTGPKDDSFIDRAWAYQRWVGVFMMVNHFETKKTTFEIARQTFDRVK